jgi:PAS domain S-box-containing protein
VSEPATDDAQEFIRELFNYAPCGVHSLDAEGRFVEINDTELGWLGYQREEVVGKLKMQDLLTPASQEVFRRKVLFLKAQGAVHGVEMDLFKRDGSVIHVLVSATAVTDPDGRFVLSRFTMFDVTELREDQQLKRRLAAIVESSDDAIIGETTDRVIVDWNAGAENIFGYTAEEMKGRSMSIMVPPGRELEFLEHSDRVKRAESVRHFETVRLKKDGTAINVSLTLSPIRDDQGKMLGISTIARDITERKRADEALQISERQLRQLLEAAPDAILQIDRAGRIALANDAAEKIFGYTRAELLGMTVETLVPHAARTAHLAHRVGYVDHPVTRPMGVGLNLSAQRKDGTLLPVEISLSPSRNGDLHVIAIVRDVSERAKAEELVRLSEERLRQAEKLEALARLAGGTAHEFNNLLTMVLGYAELLQPTVALHDDSRDYVDKIRSAAKRAAHLTRQLLAFGRRQTMNTQELEMNAMLEDAGRSLSNLLGPSVIVSVTPASEPVWVRADPIQIHQMIANLAMNAREAMPSGGRLNLMLTPADLAEPEIKQHPGMKAGRYVLLTVTDTGSGMAPEVQARVFEPFFSTRQFGKSAGLGLAMVYGIVSQSGGAVSVHSEIGHGTTFSIYLPRLEHGHRSPKERSSLPLQTLRGTETILLVEDQEHLLALTREFLTRLGYKVLPAANAEEAIQVSEEFAGAIHMLLTDVVMPGLNGHQLARTLGAARPTMKVLYVSGYSDEEFHPAGEPRTVDLLEKPYELEELAQKIRQMM